MTTVEDNGLERPEWTRAKRRGMDGMPIGVEALQKENKGKAEKDRIGRETTRWEDR